jgi:anthranilate synthase/aminodeoxychorismate synthase-like glutamine amidotransferase
MKRVLLYDNYDSFTYLIADYLKQSGATVDIITNTCNYKKLFSPSKYAGVVLSPGPQRPENAGKLLEFFTTYHTQIPMLGICLGMQAMGMYFGLNLIKAHNPMHGKLSEIEIISTSTLFKGLPQTFNVCRYHSLILEGSHHEIMITAKTNTNEIMAFEHKNLSIMGVQFHPEAILTECGMEIIKNWMNNLPNYVSD